jgi:hypothetical protein
VLVSELGSAVDDIAIGSVAWPYLLLARPGREGPILGLDRLPYASAPSISEICIRRCEPVHICPARLVPRSSGALQRGREKCVPSFLPSQRLRPFSQLA